MIAYMSTIHVNPDLAIELFVLEPEETPEGPTVTAGDEISAS